MNCSVCNAPLDQDMQFCLKCGTKVAAGSGADTQAMPPPLPKKSGMSTGCIVAIILAGIFAIPALGILAALLLPAISQARMQANAAAMNAKARDIYIGIVAANVEREPLGLGSVWPKTQTSANKDKDAMGQAFKTSTDYFKALYDEEHIGTDKWEPCARGFDYSKLAGAGVFPCEGKKLTAENNAWAIAANITDSDDDNIPLLLTRNVDVKLIERAVNKGLKAHEFNTRVDLGTGGYTSPFGGRLCIVIRKGGAAFTMRSHNATLGSLFNNQELPPRDPSKPPIVYLMP